MQQNQNNMPCLRIVPVSELLLHEQHDAQRTGPLVQRLQSDGVLRNPPIVAPIDGGQSYVVLDGANRVTAMRSLQIDHIAVQVVDYEGAELVLDCWHHLVDGLSSEQFRRILKDVVGVRCESTELAHAQALLARREVLAFVQYPDGEVWGFHARGDLHDRTRRLNDVVDAYKSRGRIYRTSTHHLPTLLPLHDEVAALVVFPRFAPAEIVDLARIGACLPAGITRHLIPGRALRINLPLEILVDDQGVEQKNAWLDHWIREKLATRSARYYQESTFMFDE